MVVGAVFKGGLGDGLVGWRSGGGYGVLAERWCWGR